MKKTLKLSAVALFISHSLVANAGISIVDTEKGNFAIGGNVELNFNYQEREQSNDSEFNQDGRVLVEFAGERYSSNGNYVALKAQPLFLTTGDLAMDDAYLEFGQQNGWAIKAGRFEAYDMFPVGLDVFLEYSGDTSNELYNDNHSYLYQSKEYRGRGSDGQFMYFQNFDNIYVEVGAMIGDRSDLFGGDTYHGAMINDNTKDAVGLRPVIGYKTGDFTFAASMETQLVKNAVTTTINGKTVDLLDRTGYGLTSTYAKNDVVINANFAYLDAVDETNTSFGINTIFKDFGLGYVYGSSDYENDQISNYAEGKVNVGTWYSSYEFADVLSVPDFSVLLGAYYTTVDTDLNTNSHMFKEENDFGGRIRLFYEF